MTTAALTLTLSILAALTIMQILLISGAPIGRYAWGGNHRVLPQRLRVAAGGAILLYIAFAGLVMSRVGILPGGETTAVIVATWILFGYSALSIILNAASRSRHERAVQIPLSALLALGLLVLALRPAH